LFIGETSLNRFDRLTFTQFGSVEPQSSSIGHLSHKRIIILSVLEQEGLYVRASASISSVQINENEEENEVETHPESILRNGTFDHVQQILIPLGIELLTLEFTLRED